MRVASQLRIAIGVLIVLLAGILAAALYVPYQLQKTSNDRYIEDAIPLRTLVHELREHVLSQEAAVETYVLTGDRARLPRYYASYDEVNGTLREIRAYAGRHREIAQLVRKATLQLGDLSLQLELQIEERGTPTRTVVGRRVEAILDQLRATSNAMLDETNESVAAAERDQTRLYNQSLFVLASLGSLALAIGLALFLLTPRRVGQLYEAEQRSREEAESRAEAARALAHVSDGVILTDGDGRVRFWNPGAEKLTGIDEHGAIGRELVRLLPAWQQLARQPDAHSGAGAAAVLPIELGHERWLSVTRVDFGEGVVYAVRDVTEERALETMRSDFVATASHELRTPLTSISGAAQTLLRRGGDLGDEHRYEFLHMIVSESDRLARIVDQILLASRIEAGRIDVRPVHCDAYEIARSVVDAARIAAPDGIAISLESRSGLHQVECDPDRLRQVLGNILENAIKYSPDGGEVRVALEERGNMMRFVVRDEGMGFEPGDADTIFDRFHRLDPHQTKGIGGTGLGLYICRELVQRMGGRIWAKSEPGDGACFSFELPLAREVLAAS